MLFLIFRVILQKKISKNSNMAVKKNNTDDLGLGTKTGVGRSMNKDGTFNIERLGEPRFRPYEVFHQLITMSWPKFILLVLIGYTIINLVFATIYCALGVEHISGIDLNLSPVEKYFEAFFFSSQTITTLGYGHVFPVGTATSSVAAIESMLGLLSFALATGLLYGRFSRADSKLLYSKDAVVAPYKDKTGLMFRVANMRRNQLIEVEVEITLAYFERDAKIRSFVRLELERSRINLFPLSWTVVHPIDENSPVYGWTENDIRETKAEMIILLKAFDDTFSQTIYSRSSYKPEEIKFGKKYLPMFKVLEDGRTQLDLRLIDAMEEIALPKQQMIAQN
jgi:inward rectifier potassium channel